jgi:26S proteasome regulatory subunit N5
VFLFVFKTKCCTSYYRQITLERMSELLHQSRDATELHVAELVNLKMIHAKIDRPKGIVVFRTTPVCVFVCLFVLRQIMCLFCSPKKGASELMENWSTNLKDLLKKIDHVGHLVHRELVINAKQQGLTAAEAE